MQKLRVAAAVLIVLLGGCNVLWGPTGEKGNWPFSSPDYRTYKLEAPERAPLYYPRLVSLSKSERGLNWSAQFEYDTYSGEGSVELIGKKDGLNIYGFSVNAPPDLAPLNSGTSQSLGAVFGVIHEIRTNLGVTYRADLMKCGERVEVKVCEAKSYAEAWQVLRSKGFNFVGTMNYTEVKDRN
ncbi:hypothetical protein [Candidatus Phycosocius spiralis]|uniref:Lipoprotein n=1 Tax=Candidatus Phycosocius spiralis TaxID=2815099 RepID=A0ABQ4PVU2_9PROT|nr:hypothetical protein [Candidatus Phycosocius spiralis]GIU67101.1 hypothetical protein PsB1_1255 [Candidatus Phycosocius spiralis]